MRKRQPLKDEKFERFMKALEFIAEEGLLSNINTPLRYEDFMPEEKNLNKQK